MVSHGTARSLGDWVAEDLKLDIFTPVPMLLTIALNHMHMTYHST